VVVYSFILMTLPSLLVALPFWTWPRHPETWALLLGVGGCAVAGQMATTKAFALADATAVLPYDFARMVCIGIIGVLIFAEPFDRWTLLGALIIFGSTVYLAHRERVAARVHKPASAPNLDR
jgi:drug/metabolite transporter (DMT)-like permease